MEISPLMMAMLLFYAVLFGIFMGVFYDANRILRVFFGVRYDGVGTQKIADLNLPFIKKPLGNKSGKQTGRALRYTIVFLGDFFCFVAAGIGIIILNYSYNSGEFRYFTVLGVILGFLLYYFSVGKLTIFLLEPAAMLIKYAVLSFFIIFWRPPYIIGKNIIKKLSKTIFLCTFTLEKQKERVYNIREEVYLLEMSKNGFLD